jgi:hypothetical protein
MIMLLFYFYNIMNLKKFICSIFYLLNWLILFFLLFKISFEECTML